MERNSTNIKFTKRELQLMELLWNSHQPLSANEISNSLGVSVFTVQQVLKKLLDREIIGVHGVSHTKNAITRVYVPILNQSDYVSTSLSQSSFFKLSLNFLKNATSEKELLELQKLINEKLKELE